MRPTEEMSPDCREGRCAARVMQESRRLKDASVSSGWNEGVVDTSAIDANVMDASMVGASVHVG